MAYKVRGRLLSTSAVSLAKYALGIYPNRYRGNRKKYTREYWNKVVNFLGREYRIDKPTIRSVRKSRRYVTFAP